MHAQELWASTPPITRFFVYLVGLVTVLGSFNFVSFSNFVLCSPPSLPCLDTLVYKFQLWRLITTFGFHGVLGGSGTLMTVFNIIFCFMWLKRLESNMFEGKPASFVYFVAIIFGCLITLSLLGFYLINFGFPFMGMAFTMSMVWVFTRMNPTETLSLFGYVDVSAHWFPWIVVFIHFVLGQNWAASAAGILAGNVYYYLKEMLPLHGGPRLLDTPPRFLLDAFPEERIMGGFQAYAPTVVRPEPTRQAPTGHAWGSGRRLGE